MPISFATVSGKARLPTAYMSRPAVLMASSVKLATPRLFMSRIRAVANSDSFARPSRPTTVLPRTSRVLTALPALFNIVALEATVPPRVA